MEHTQVKEQFSDYWEGTLGEEARAEVAGHLAGCAECRAEYEAFERAMTPLARLGRMAAPADMRVTVPDLIRRRSRGRFFGRRRLWQRVPLELLSLLTLGVVVAAYLLFKLSQPAVHLP